MLKASNNNSFQPCRNSQVLGITLEFQSQDPRNWFKVKSSYCWDLSLIGNGSQIKILNGKQRLITLNRLIKLALRTSSNWVIRGRIPKIAIKNPMIARTTEKLTWKKHGIDQYDLICCWKTGQLYERWSKNTKTLWKIFKFYAFSFKLALLIR